MFDSLLCRIATVLLLACVACQGESKQIEVWIERDTPLPSILAFYAAPEIVAAGTPTTLHWSTRDAVSLSLVDASGTEVPLGGVEVASGSVEVHPEASTSYTLTALGASGSPGPVWRTVRVLVEDVEADAPVIESFGVSTGEVAIGDEVALSWRTTGAARLKLQDDAAVEIELGDADVAEGHVVVRPTRSPTTYYLTATGPGGHDGAATSVRVAGLPGVTRFFVDPITPVARGDSVTLTWETQNVERVVVRQGAVVLVDGTAEPSGSREIVLEDTTTFDIVASGHGASATARALARVGPRIVSFTASERMVRPGDPIELAWGIEDADRAAIDGPGGFHLPLTGAELAAGTANVNVTVAGDFVLRTFRGDVGQTGTLRVDVTAAPQVRSFGVDRAMVTASATYPANVTLSWIQDGADSCTILRNREPVAEYAAFACGRTGTASVQLFGTSELRLVASNAVGSHAGEVDVSAMPPATIVAFAAQPARRVTPGTTVQLSWAVADAVSISMTKNGAAFPVGTTAFTGTANDVVDLDSVYELTALNAFGHATVAELTVRAGAPILLAAAATPSFVGVGDATTLSWNADGGETLTVSDDAGVELFRTTDAATIDGGSLRVLVPVVAGTHGYRITVANGLGDFDEARIEVVVSDGPIIESFVANKAALSLGDTLTFSWKVRNDASNNAPSLTLLDNHGNGFDTSAQNPNLGSLTITPLEEGPYVYTLTASTGPTRAAATAMVGTPAAPIEVTVPPVVLSFTATPDRVGTGGGTVVPDVVLAWQTEKGVEVTLWESDAAGEVYPPAFHKLTRERDGQAALDSGSLHVHPTASTWYVLRVRNQVGTKVSKKLKVVVDPPEFLTLDAIPPTLILGQPAQLSWTTRYASFVVVDPPPAPLTVTPAQFPFVDISGTGRRANGIDGDCGLGVIQFPAGFTFPFDGVERTAIQVSANGWAGFNLGNTSCEHFPARFPADARRFVNLAPYWCDLDNTKGSPTGQLWYGLHKDPMGEYLVIQFKDWAWSSATNNPSNLNFEIILRSSGVFEYRYGAMAAPGGKAAGENCGIGYQYPGAGSPAANIAAFYQAVPDGLANKGFVLGAQQPANGSLAVTPARTTTYTVAAVNEDSSAFGRVTVSVWKTPVITAVKPVPTAPQAAKPFTIEWSVADATQVRILDGAGLEICNELDPAKILSGSCTYVEATPGVRTYTLEARNGPLGAPVTTVTRPFNVFVFPLLSLDSLAVAPGNFVESGTPVTVTWTATGALEMKLLACKPHSKRTACVDVTPAGANPNGGSYTQPMTASVEFWLQIWDVSYRLREGSQQVWVDAASLDTFEAPARQIAAGSSSTLSWTTTGATSVMIDGLVPAAPIELTGTAPYLDISGIGAAASQVIGDANSGYYDVVFPAGWVFPWFGSARSAVRVSTDGWLTFDMAQTAANSSEWSMPTGPGWATVQIAPFWDDLSRGAVYWKADQTSQGVKYVVVQWKNFSFSSSTYNPSDLNFEVLLYETGDIEFRYGLMAGNAGYPNQPKGDSATIGWQNPGGTAGKMLTAASGDVVSPALQNRSWRFPTSLGPDSSVVVGPAESTTYRLCVTNAGEYVECEELRVVVVKPGDVVFSEAMIAPGTDDAEWFELKNTGPDAIDLAGFTVASGAAESFTVPASPPVIVPPGKYAVFARMAAHGLVPTVAYGDAIGLADAADELRILLGATPIDAVTWSGTGWPIQVGKSIAVEPSAMARSTNANDSATSWCATTAPYGDGTYSGSPGSIGAGCLTGGANGWYVLDPVSGAPFIDISQTGVNDSSYLDGTYLTPAIPLGFTMPYFGDTVTDLQIAKHGYLSFVPHSTATSINSALPNASIKPNGLVAPFWDTVASGSGVSSLRHQLVTVDGRKAMIVQWTTIAGTSMASGTLDAQAQLWESGDIVFAYRNVNRLTNDYAYGSGATLGLEDLAGTTGIQFFFGNGTTGGPIYSGRSFLVMRR